MIKQKNKFFLVLAILATFLFISFVKIHIVEAATITPTKYYIDIEPGETKSDELKVLGDAQQPGDQPIFVYVMGMKKVGEEDDRDFYVPDGNDAAEPANWIQLSKTNFTLGAGDTISVPFTITASKISRCGTNLAAIFVSNTPNDNVDTNSSDGSIVGIKNSLVAQVHINVSDKSQTYCTEVKTKLQLLDFKLDSATPIFNYDNIPFVTRIENDGNLLSQSPKGYIEMFGIGPKITIPFNDENLDIYPGTTRKFSNTYVDPNYPVNGSFIEQMIYEVSHFRFGAYEARLGVTFNVSPKIVSSITVWIIPWRPLLVLLLIIAFIILMIVRDRKRSHELKKLKKSSRHYDK